MGSSSRDVVGVPANLIHAAENANLAHPLRVWLVARAVEGKGTGHIRKTELVSGLMKRGVCRGSAFGWTRDLVAHHFASYATNERGETIVVFRSVESLMERFATGRSNRDVKIGLDALLSRAYRRNLAACSRAALSGRPMSRMAVREVTGVSASTQRRGERDLGASVCKNAKRLGSARTIQHAVVLRTTIPAMDHPAIFAVGDDIYHRLPNSTSFPKVSVTHRRRNCPGHWAGQATQRGERRYHDGKKIRHRIWRNLETRIPERVLVKHPLDLADPIVRDGFEIWSERS